MIYNLKENVVCEFGTGDINVGCGVDADCITPSVYFANSIPKEIGELNNDTIKEDENGLPRAKDDNIKFVFNKPESIDVIIQHLKKAKSLFEVEEKKRLAVVVRGYNQNLNKGEK